MPQFDIFFYFNAIFYFLISFTALYFLMSFFLLPRILAVLKIRKQKLDFLYKMSVLYKMRIKFIDISFFSKNLKLLVLAVQLVCSNFSKLLKKH